MVDEVGNAFLVCFGFKGKRNDIYSKKMCKHAPKKHVCKHFKAVPRECVKIEKSEGVA